MNGYSAVTSCTSAHSEAAAGRRVGLGSRPSVAASPFISHPDQDPYQWLLASDAALFFTASPRPASALDALSSGLGLSPPHSESAASPSLSAGTGSEALSLATSGSAFAPPQPRSGLLVAAAVRLAERGLLGAPSPMQSWLPRGPDVPPLSHAPGSMHPLGGVVLGSPDAAAPARPFASQTPPGGPPGLTASAVLSALQAPLPGGAQGFAPGPLPPPSGGGSAAASRWVQPSGPRQAGLGTEDQEQGILSVSLSPCGGGQVLHLGVSQGRGEDPPGIVLKVTLLAAGFVIGPSGASIRDVCRVTGADVKSWTTAPSGGPRAEDTGSPPPPARPSRTFCVQGPPEACLAALEIVCDAVCHYKSLCEGAFAGQSVPRVQRLWGINFWYQPPPRSVVPHAASLAGQSARGSRSRGKERRARGKAREPGGGLASAGGGPGEEGRASVAAGEEPPAAPGVPEPVGELWPAQASSEAGSEPVASRELSQTASQTASNPTSTSASQPTSPKAATPPPTQPTLQPFPPRAAGQLGAGCHLTKDEVLRCARAAVGPLRSTFSRPSSRAAAEERRGQRRGQAYDPRAVLESLAQLSLQGGSRGRRGTPSPGSVPGPAYAAMAAAIASAPPVYLAHAGVRGTGVMHPGPAAARAQQGGGPYAHGMHASNLHASNLHAPNLHASNLQASSSGLHAHAFYPAQTLHHHHPHARGMHRALSPRAAAELEAAAASLQGLNSQRLHALLEERRGGSAAGLEAAIQQGQGAARAPLEAWPHEAWTAEALGGGGYLVGQPPPRVSPGPRYEAPQQRLMQSMEPQRYAGAAGPPPDAVLRALKSLGEGDAEALCDLVPSFGHMGRLR